MAEAFAQAYRLIPWTAAYVSPMKRTIATAKPLREALGLEMQLRDGLKEIRYGKWEGKSVDFVKQHYWDDYIRWLAEPAWNPLTGGETSVEISSRASLVIAEIQEKYAKDSVLVVSHKATIRIILCELLGIDLGRYRDRIDMPAGLVSIVKFDVHGPTGIGRSCLLGRRCTFQTRNLSLPEVVGKLLKATLVGSISHQV